MKKVLLFIIIAISADTSFAQKKYEFPVRYLPYFFEHIDTIYSKIYNRESDFKIYVYDQTKKNSIQIFKTEKPFSYEFLADSCTISKSNVFNIKDNRLSDSVSTFTYTIAFYYKNESQSKKDFANLCRIFDFKTITNQAISKTVYFELDNAPNVVISHDLQLYYEKLGQGRNAVYTFSLTFKCNGERDTR